MISQEMFDEVVLENVNDFDKPLEEAIQDTMQEFEAQVRTRTVLIYIIKKKIINA